MLDERNEAVPANLKHQSFNSKNVAQRAFDCCRICLTFLFAILLIG